MKLNPYFKVIVVACMGAFASCASQPQTQSVPVSTSLRPASSLTEQVFREVNSYRRGHGAKDLERHAGLDRLAQKHCEYLRAHRGSFDLYGKNVSHIGFDGRALMAQQAYNMQNVSENVAAASHQGANMAPVLVNLWAGSKDHELNMRSEWKYTGLGVVVDQDGTVFSTQLFGTPANAQMAVRDRFNHF